MTDITIDNNIEAFVDNPIKQEKVPEDQKASFGEMLKNSIVKVNQLQNDADQAIKEMAAGKEKNIHKTMIALEKANVSFQLMMQVRNKIVSAYEEVMRMQV